MRPGQHNKRGRNRHRSTGGGSSSGSSGGGGGNPLSRVYESNGPDVKVRGTAQTVADKYLQLARDAQSSSDIVMAESYYQYAEHYLRIVSAAQAYSQQMQPQQYRRPGDEDDDDGDDSAEAASVEPRGQPQPAEQPDMGNEQSFDGERPQHQQNSRPQRESRDQGGQPYGSRDRETGGQPSGNREPAGQQYANRDRSRPRWQDRRDQPPNTNVETRQNAPQPRIEDQPRETLPAPMPAPAAIASEDAAQWEAPSFLRRPAPLPPVEAEAAAPVVADAQAPPRRTRKPRREASEPAVPAPETPSTAD
jgi:hypothetical protein